MRKIGMSWIAGALMMGTMACDDGVADTSENAAKCQQICNAVDECTDGDNSTDCRKECVDNSENDGFEESMEECAACVEAENSCTENVLECTAECAGVVALSST